MLLVTTTPLLLYTQSMNSLANPPTRRVAQQGHRKGVSVQSSFKDLVPLQQRTDVSSETREMVRPSEEDVQATAERTKLALEKLVNGKIKAAQPKHVPNLQGKTDFMRYTPQQGGVGQQKIIKMVKIPLFSLSPRFSSSSPRPSLHLPNSPKSSPH